ncbi:hypothetical protein PVAG01_00658 [Phlyctema vagabunda]|uniref:SGNH hydrolase-type esterase domain-containing protein n=1 Tax=Phlyctema vagabunda TaxID=108571 RepID=A0ABR4PV48_9HELO
MRALNRLGAAFALSCLSMVTITLLLPRSRVSTKLQKIALGVSMDDYVPDLWRWASGDQSGVEDGIRLVVFGDSWADSTVHVGAETKGLNWVDVLCEEINCTSHVNFAVSQPPQSHPAAPATGALTSNTLYLQALNSFLPRTSSYLPGPSELLPDLEAQIEKYLALPASRFKPKETIFVISFGAWDIYHFSGLDFKLSERLVDVVIHNLFEQIDKLYNRYRAELIGTDSAGQRLNITDPAPFRIIVPRLFDTTLLPGWSAQRPVPLTPSSVAEQQKNAVYLTTRWNAKMESKIAGWIKNDTLPPPATAKAGKDVKEEPKDEARDNNTSPTDDASEPEVEPITVPKDAFYYDIARYLTDAILEYQLAETGISDAAGLGTKGTSFESVALPCVLSSADDDPREGDTEVNGLLVCRNPAGYLFWDDFRLGPTANEQIGSGVAQYVLTGRTVRQIWKAGKVHG